MNSSIPAANSKGDLPSPFQSPPHLAVLSLFHGLAIVFTIVRLTRRIRIRRFSWDDTWAAVSLVFLVIYMAAIWHKLKMVKGGQSVDLQTFRNRLRTLYKLNIATYTAVVWSSRVSLSLSIARIFPQGRLRLTAIILSIICLLTGLVLIIGKTVTCSISFPDPSPAGKPQVDCMNSIGSLFVVQIVGDILSSVTLVIFPIRALFPNTSELPPSERRLILVLLTSTTVTLAMCLATAASILKRDPFRMILFSDLEASVSLMVCNFLVVITSVWRILSRWFSREKSSGPAEEVQTAEDRHVTVYNSGEDSLAISPSSRGSRSTNTTNSDSATSSHRTNTTTMSGFSTLTDIATFSLRSMELGAVGSRSDPHSNGRQSGRSVMAG